MSNHILRDDDSFDEPLAEPDLRPFPNLTEAKHEAWVEAKMPDWQNEVSSGKAKALHELTAWWAEQASADAARTIPKAIEYGDTDLIDVGRAVARVSGRPSPTDAEAAELGVYVYLAGKLGRWTAALAEGRVPSDDTLFDVSIYAMMARRIRQTGGWPGKEN